MTEIAAPTVKFGGDASGAIAAAEKLKTSSQGLVATVGESLARAFGKSTAAGGTLNAQMAVLSSRAKELKSEMDETSAAYRKGGEAAEGQAAKLQVLGEELHQIKVKMAEVAEQSAKMGTMRDIVTIGPSGVGMKLREYAGALSSFGIALTAIFAGQKIIEHVNEISKLGEELRNMSDATGISVRTLSDWRYAAQQAGVDTELFNQSLSRLARNIQEALKSPSSSIAQSFEKLGMSQQFLRDNSQNLEVVVRRLADAIKNNEAGGQTLAFALEVLSKSGGKLIPVLKDGSAGLDEMAAKNRALGGEIDRLQADEMVRYLQSTRDLSTAWEGFSIRLTNEVVPSLITVLHTIEELMMGMNKLMDMRPSDDSFIGKILSGAGSVAKYLPYPLNIAAYEAGGLTQKSDSEKAEEEKASAAADAAAKGKAGTGPGNLISDTAYTDFEDKVAKMQADWAALGRSKASILQETVAMYEKEIAAGGEDATQLDQLKKAYQDYRKTLADQDYSDELRKFDGMLAQMQADMLAAGKSRAEIATQTAAMWQKEIGSGKLSQDQQLEAQRTLQEARRAAVEAQQSQDVAIARQGAEAEIRIDTDKLAAAKSNLTTLLNEKKITTDQWVAELKNYTTQINELDQQALTKELEGLKGLPAQYNAVYEQLLEMKQKLVTQLAALDEQASQKAKQDAAEEARAWKSAIDEITGAEQKLATDMLNRKRTEIYYAGGPGKVGKLEQMSAGQTAMRSLEGVSSGLINKEMTSDLKFYSEKMLSSLIGIEGPKGGGGILATGLGKLFGGGKGAATPEQTLTVAGTSLNTAGTSLKAAATALTTAAAKIGTMPAGGEGGAIGAAAEGGPTERPAMGLAAAADNSLASTSATSSIVSSITNLGSLLTGKSTSMFTTIISTIMTIGQLIFSGVMLLFMKPSVLGTTFAMGGIVPSAAGGMVVGGGGGGVPAILHPREMVLPRPISEGIQSMIAGGGPRSQPGHTTQDNSRNTTVGNTHINVNIGGSNHTPASITAAVSKAARDFHPAALAMMNGRTA